ncbi:MAG: hypothetical protein ACE5DI_02860 [Candidatus Micrarchaeia archaeon]
MVSPGVQDQYSTVTGQAKGGFEDQDLPHTILHTDSNEKLPPFLRTNSRWNYLLEYIDFWKGEKKTILYFFFFLAAGFVTLPIFVPGGLLMFAMAARLKSMAYWNKFVYNVFGKNRTLIFVD